MTHRTNPTTTPRERRVSDEDEEKENAPAGTETNDADDDEP
jgi:hypothetical protein